MAAMLLSGITGAQTVQAKTQKNPVTTETFVSSDGKTWSPESIETFEYDEKGRMVSDLRKWDYQPWNSGQERLCGARKETYQYNEKGKLIKSVTYDTENQAPDALQYFQKKTCQYDKQGRKIKETIYDENKEVQFCTITKYQGNNKQLQVVKTYRDGIFGF